MSRKLAKGGAATGSSNLWKPAHLWFTGCANNWWKKAPALPSAAPSSEVSPARIWGLGARRMGKFTVVVSILPQTSADDGLTAVDRLLFLVGHRSSAEGRRIE